MAYALIQTNHWGSTMYALFLVAFLNHLVFHAAIVKDTSSGSSGGLDAPFVSSICLSYLFKVTLQRECFLKKKYNYKIRISSRWTMVV